MKISEDHIVRTKDAQWLLFPVENKSREFDSKIFMGSLAAERGYKVLIGSYTAFRNWITCLPRGVVMEKCISIGKKHVLDRYIKLGNRIIVSDEESLSIFLDPEEFLRARLDSTTLEMVDSVFAWNEPQAKLMRDAFPNLANKIVMTGTQRADLWRKELRGIYEKEVIELKKRFGKYILFPSNFSGPINVVGVEYIFEKNRNYGFIRNNEEEQARRDQIRHKETNLEKFTSAFNRISDHFPNHTLIIRPHPADNHDYWIDTVKSINNAHVIYEGSPTPWLMGADAIFHHGCSTGIEARIMGRCAIAYHPHSDERFDLHPSTQLGPVAYTEEELINFLQSSVDNPDGCTLKPGEADRYIDATEGAFASERMLDAIDKLSWDSESMNLTWSNPKAAAVRIHEGWRRTRRKIRLAVEGNSNRMQNRLSRTRQKWPGATAEEAGNIITSLGNELGRFDNVQVQEVTPDIMYLSLKD